MTGTDVRRLHAFRDLKAYVCTFSDQKCQNELFDDRDMWFEHELHYHRSQYNCNLCGEGVFTSKSVFELHIELSHGSFAPDQMSMLVDTGRQVPSSINARDCPFCDEWAETIQFGRNGELKSTAVSPTRFKRHVATHQEQLAIFSVPRSSEHWGTQNSQSAHSWSNELSARASDDGDYQGSVLDEHVEWAEQDRAEVNTLETRDSKYWICCRCANLNDSFECFHCLHVRDGGCLVSPEPFTERNVDRSQEDQRAGQHSDSADSDLDIGTSQSLPPRRRLVIVDPPPHRLPSPTEDQDDLIRASPVGISRMPEDQIAITSRDQAELHSSLMHSVYGGTKS